MMWEEKGGFSAGVGGGTEGEGSREDTVALARKRL